MPISIKADIGYTSKSVEFYKRYKEAFGEVITAEMISNPTNVEFKLIFNNNVGEQLIFEGGLTAGYLGEGCRGTQKVLGLAGFPITDEFILNNTAFKLTK